MDWERRRVLVLIKNENMQWKRLSHGKWSANDEFIFYYLWMNEFIEFACLALIVSFNGFCHLGVQWRLASSTNRNKSTEWWDFVVCETMEKQMVWTSQFYYFEEIKGSSRRHRRRQKHAKRRKIIGYLAAPLNLITIKWNAKRIKSPADWHRSLVPIFIFGILVWNGNNMKCLIIHSFVFRYPCSPHLHPVHRPSTKSVHI